MPEYYRISKPGCGDWGVAYALDYDDILFLPYSGLVENWTPLHFELRDGGYADYLSSDICQRFCSERFRSLLDLHATEHDEIQWLETVIRKGSAERPYYILHFPNPPKVLDKRHTIFSVGDAVVKPILSKKKAVKHAIFSFPKDEGVCLFISEEVKSAIEAAGITGIEISRAPSR